MTVHREPTTGYASDAKQEYREKVWKSFARRKAIHYANVYDNAFILIMPGLGTEEIDTAVDYGMDPEKIICVHESAAHVAASAKWRKKYPKTPFYCCKISEVMEKLVRDKRYLTGANLDFCNNFSGELIDEVMRFVVPGVIGHNFVLQLNIMAARESGTATSIIRVENQKFAFEMQRLAKTLKMYNKGVEFYDGSLITDDGVEHLPVYASIECERIRALMLATSVIDRVGNQMNCFVDMAGRYVNNKVPMSHISIVIQNQFVGTDKYLLNFRYKKKNRADKFHADRCEGRMIDAANYIDQFGLMLWGCEPQQKEGENCEDKQNKENDSSGSDASSIDDAKTITDLILFAIKAIGDGCTIDKIPDRCLYRKATFGMSRADIYRNLEKMKSGGLIDYPSNTKKKYAKVVIVA